MDSTPTPRILVISGSTREGSTNTALARTASTHARVLAHTALKTLPQFDPDDDHDAPPESIQLLRGQIRAADAVLFCTPEYAGALPGAFKNLLDWMVGSTVLTDKPVGWVNVASDSRRGSGARAEIATVLGYVQARVTEAWCIDLPVDRDNLLDGVITDERSLAAIDALLHRVADDLGRA